jgi:hypothetical protein
MGARGLRGFHFHHSTLYVRHWDCLAAFFADELRLFAHDLNEAAAAIRTEKLVGNDRQRHGFIKAWAVGAAHDQLMQIGGPGIFCPLCIHEPGSRDNVSGYHHLQFIHFHSPNCDRPLFPDGSVVVAHLLRDRLLTMYFADHKEELDDFLKFGRLMYYEMGRDQKLDGKLLNQLVPDHDELRAYFLEKRNRRGGKLLSWHGMTINDLGKAVGMEKYSDQQIVRSQYAKASKLVHGDSLLTVLVYDLDHFGMRPVPFAEPTIAFRIDAVAATCGLFIALLASVDCGLMIGFQTELGRLNAVWRQVWKDATGVDVDEALRNLNKPEQV